MAELTVDVAPDGACVVSDGSRRWHVYVAGTPDDRWVFVNGQVMRVERATKSRAAVRTRGSGDMSAPMPATVVNVLVAPGSRVAKGDIVVTLEAMKMELAIRASRDGLVRRVLVEAGQLVQPGAPLLELE